VGGAPGDLFISPVVALAVIDEGAGERIVRPLCYVQETGVDTWWDAGDALGYLLQEDVSRAREIFAAEITREKRRRDFPGQI